MRSSTDEVALAFATFSTSEQGFRSILAIRCRTARDFLSAPVGGSTALDGRSGTAGVPLHQRISRVGSGISLENDSVVEKNKYVLLHAHNPKFNGEFNSLSYKAFKQLTLTPMERSMMDVVGADFKATMEGLEISVGRIWCTVFSEISAMVSMTSE
jgi:hypothetical protein